MATPWIVKAREFANCNCAYGCPCQFNALPTHGDCRAVNAYVIDEGHFAGTRLDGLLAVGLYAWPRAVHEGNGSMQLVIDERADAAQRQALVKIMSGEETKDMATMWWVYSAMCPTKFPPLFKPIAFDIDVDGRRARLSVPGIIEAAGEPIRNPITGDPHRARIELPDGFEYRIAEVGSGTTRADGAVALDFRATHGHFARIHLGNDGARA